MEYFSISISAVSPGRLGERQCRAQRPGSAIGFIASVNPESAGRVSKKFAWFPGNGLSNDTSFLWAIWGRPVLSPQWNRWEENRVLYSGLERCALLMEIFKRGMTGTNDLIGNWRRYDIRYNLFQAIWNVNVTEYSCRKYHFGSGVVISYRMLI